MRYFSVPENLLSAIGNYLVSRPYQEVANLIRGLETEAKLISTEAEKEIKDEKAPLMSGDVEC